jgi:hypothetical protein
VGISGCPDRVFYALDGLRHCAIRFCSDEVAQNDRFGLTDVGFLTRLPAREGEDGKLGLAVARGSCRGRR